MRWSLPLGRFSARRLNHHRAHARRLRSLRSEPLEARQLLALTFMGDLNPTHEPADVRNLLADGDQLYFARETAGEGEELWTSDGTPEGTRLLKDVRPGAEGSRPRPLLAHDGIVYFTIDNVVEDRPLWRTDGTVEGTYVLAPDVPAEVVVVQDQVYFTRYGEHDLRGLYRTDGTVEGTERVYFTHSGISQLTPFGETLAFVLHDNSLLGSELWKYDPATSDASLVRDIFSGADSGFHENFWGGITAYDDVLYFTATNGITGRELWRSDGTWNGTYVLAEFNPGQAHGFAYGDRVQIAGLGSHLFVVAEDGIHGREVWRVDTLTGAAEMTADLIPVGSSGEQVDEPIFAGVFDGALLFQIATGSYEVTLWQVTETTLPTHLRVGASVGIGVPAVVNNELYYLLDGETERRLVRQTSLDAAPQLLTRIRKRVAEFTPSTSGLYFTNADSDDGSPRLWKTDGTPEGTLSFTDDLNLRPLGSTNFETSVVGESVFLLSNRMSNDSTLWLMTPDSQTARPVNFLASNDCDDCYLNVWQLAPSNDTGQLYFWARSDIQGSSGLWRADALGENATLVSSNVSPSRNLVLLLGTNGDEAYFLEHDQSTGRRTLAKSSSAIEGSVEIMEFPEGTVAERLSVVHQGDLFFTVRGRSGWQLWRTDGTAGGTQLVREFPQFGSVAAMAAANEQLFVSVLNGSPEDRGLWAGDGTQAGSRRVSIEASQRLLATPEGVYFSGYDAAHGRELWFSDGATAHLVADLQPGPAGALDDVSLQTMLAFEGQVYFTAEGSPGSFGLWRVASNSATPELFQTNAGSPQAIAGALFFGRWTLENATTLWRSDGTVEGSTMVVDGISGPNGPITKLLGGTNTAVYFYATTPEYGSEPWRLTLEPGDTNYDNVINLQDLNNVRNNFGGTGLGDTNGDGVVNIADLNAVRNHYGAATPQPLKATPYRDEFDRTALARDAVFAMHVVEDVRASKRAAKRRN